jgi:hypothetical protein
MVAHKDTLLISDLRTNSMMSLRNTLRLTVIHGQVEELLWEYAD